MLHLPYQTLDECFAAAEAIRLRAGGAILLALRQPGPRRQLRRVARRYAYLLGRPGGDERLAPRHPSGVQYHHLFRDLNAGTARQYDAATLRERRQDWARRQQERFRSRTSVA